MSEQPNFVFIITDQHRADYLGCTGHPVLKTPHIDQIARRGSNFNRFYVSSPVCMPNRASLMTGRLSSVNGVRQNGNDLPKHMTTFTQALKAGGYDTALLGKAHLQTMTDFPTPIGENPAGKGPLANAINIGEESDYLSESNQQWLKKGDKAVDLPFYGFDVADIVSFHGDRTGCAHEIWLKEQVDDPEKLRGPKNQLPHNYTCPQAIRTAMPEELYSTTYIKDRAIDYLSSSKRKQKPFFAFVSFPDPHHPFTPPGKYWDRYSPEDMPIPENFSRHRNPPQHLQWVRDKRPADPHEFESEPSKLTRRQAQEAMALTCGMISMIDDAVGEIVQTLKKQGLEKNTILIFNADHGDYMGDHGLLFKGGMHFQSLIRVPLLWFDPMRRQRRNINTLCSTIDLAPTIMARAGVTAYSGVQGEDLSKLISGRGKPLKRESLLIEEDTYRTNILGFSGQVRLRSLLTERYRLTVYHGADWGELYDLQQDPMETHNLWDMKKHRRLRSELLWELMQTMMGYSDRSPWPKQEA